jgi:hypothetical protein
MQPSEVVTHWENTFERMGYRQTKPNNWVEETRELIIVLRVIMLPGDFHFYVDVALIIKKLYHYGALNYPVFRYYHLGQSLWTLLYHLGEKERRLNKLFCFDPIKISDSKIITNISKLAMLYQQKTIPFFETLDQWVSVENDFDDRAAWEPFYKYFQPSLNIDQCYR